MPTRGDENIAAFDVTVDDCRAMGSIQGVSTLSPQFEQALHVERTPANQMFERLTLEIFHDQKGSAVGFGNLEQHADIGVVQCGCGASLTTKASQRTRIVGNLFGQELDGYKSAKPGIFCLENNTHPTPAQFFDDAV